LPVEYLDVGLNFGCQWARQGEQAEQHAGAIAPGCHIACVLPAAHG
jgi:hypothetical protein